MKSVGMQANTTTHGSKANEKKMAVVWAAPESSSKIYESAPITPDYASIIMLLSLISFACKEK
jgi:hypothetical protein